MASFTSDFGIGSGNRYEPSDLLYPAGNIVEWQYPSEVSLEDVEFKSLASGLHHVEKDFV